MASAATFAPVYVYLNFWRTFSGYAGLNATIHINVDTSAIAYINDVALGGSFSNYGSYNFTMLGTNMIRIYAWNTNGPAGLIVAVFNQTNHVLVRSDSSWYVNSFA
jgi:hypothetical protein